MEPVPSQNLVHAKSNILSHARPQTSLTRELHTVDLASERLSEDDCRASRETLGPTLLGIAREFGVTAISRVEDLDSPALLSEVKTAERKAASAGIRGVPQISFQGTVVASGAQKEELLADSIRQILRTAGHCEKGVCAV